MHDLKNVDCYECSYCGELFDTKHESMSHVRYYSGFGSRCMFDPRTDGLTVEDKQLIVHLVLVLVFMIMLVAIKWYS